MIPIPVLNPKFERSPQSAVLVEIADNKSALSPGCLPRLGAINNYSGALANWLERRFHLNENLPVGGAIRRKPEYMTRAGG
jgi:hypothetical protein